MVNIFFFFTHINRDGNQIPSNTNVSLSIDSYYWFHLLHNQLICWRTEIAGTVYSVDMDMTLISIVQKVESVMVANVAKVANTTLTLCKHLS